MAHVPIPWPLGGLSEDRGLSDQPEGTARDARNVRGIDPKTGRIRGGQRSGLGRLGDALVGEFPKELTTVTDTNSLKNWSSEADAKGEVAPGAGKFSIGTPATVIATDSSGNIYTLHNSQLEKRNDDAEVQWTLSFSIGVHLYATSLLVSDSGYIYIATSFPSGYPIDPGDGTSANPGAAPGSEAQAAEAKILCYKETTSGEAPTDPVWEIETGAFVIQMVLDSGKLWTAQNIPHLWESKVVVYTGIEGTAASEEASVAVAFPVTGIARREGNTYTNHDQWGKRGRFPGDGSELGVGAPQARTHEVPEVADLIINAPERVWAHYRADKISEQPDAPFDGQQLGKWEDLSGNGRHLYGGSDSQHPYDADEKWQDPVYVEGSGLLKGKPGVKFNGIDQFMRGIGDVAFGDPDTVDSQSGPFPHAKNVGFTILALVTPFDITDAGAAAQTSNESGKSGRKGGGCIIGVGSSPDKPHTTPDDVVVGGFRRGIFANTYSAVGTYKRKDYVDGSEGPLIGDLRTAGTEQNIFFANYETSLETAEDNAPDGLPYGGVGFHSIAVADPFDPKFAPNDEVTGPLRTRSGVEIPRHKDDDDLISAPSRTDIDCHVGHRDFHLLAETEDWPKKFDKGNSNPNHVATQPSTAAPRYTSILGPSITGSELGPDVSPSLVVYNHSPVGRGSDHENTFGSLSQMDGKNSPSFWRLNGRPIDTWLGWGGALHPDETKDSTPLIGACEEAQESPQWHYRGQIHEILVLYSKPATSSGWRKTHWHVHGPTSLDDGHHTVEAPWALLDSDPATNQLEFMPPGPSMRHDFGGGIPVPLDSTTLLGGTSGGFGDTESSFWLGAAYRETELERLEAMIMYRWGVWNQGALAQQNLGDGSVSGVTLPKQYSEYRTACTHPNAVSFGVVPYDSPATIHPGKTVGYGPPVPTVGSENGGDTVHPTSSVSGGVGGKIPTYFYAAALQNPMMQKRVGTESEPVWIACPGFDGFIHEAVGHLIAVDSEDGIFSTGPHGYYSNATAEHGRIGVRRLIDKGDTWSQSLADGAWLMVKQDFGITDEDLGNYAELDHNPYPYAPLTVDEFDNVYVPIRMRASYTTAAITGFTGAGAAADRVYVLKREPAATQVALYWNTGHYVKVRGTAIDPNIPSYKGALNAKGGPHAEILWTHLNKDDQDGDNLRKVALATHDLQDAGSLRSVLYIVESGGSIYKFAKSGDAGTATLGTGQEELPDPLLSPTAKYVDSSVLYGNVFFTDEANYAIFRSRPEVETSGVEKDECEEWKATKGTIPDYCSLITTWRSRIVLARQASDPHMWHMSKAGDPFDWDLAPDPPTAIQAVSGSMADRAGLCPDLINAVIPYTDDFLIFGGDRSIWRLSGDPMAGGEFDLVTDVTGISFGTPWTKDPAGILYFAGSRGGIFAMQANGQFVRISLNSIERRLQDIDFSTYRFELVWNYREEGLHVFIVPYASDDAGAAQSSYFWEKKTGGWYEDDFSNLDVQPVGAAVWDGDALSDRRVTVVGRDGVLREWDEDATTDDGHNIVSAVTIGPLLAGWPRTEYESRMRGLTGVVASDAGQAGVTVKTFATDHPETLGSGSGSTYWSQGHNGPNPTRARGAYIYVQLNSSSENRWSIESMGADISRGGRARRRET